ncbi:MAG: glutamine-hydrolyzing carbamoyl-phosphate synthase small subunit [Thermoplasmata archaeon]
MRGFLVLEDGSVFEGEAFGAVREVFGEVVFATGMTGYQESLTDPSYCGQILVASYPLIGNYGVNSRDMESDRVQVWGYAVREACDTPSHRSCTMTIAEFLRRASVPGISGIDTRSLIRKLRMFGTMKGGIGTSDPDALLDRVRTMTHPEETNLVKQVSTNAIIRHDEGCEKTVAIYDCGVKASILRELRRRFNVIRLPFDTPADVVLDLRPDGLFISNGPGNPAHPDVVKTTVSALRKLKDELPIMGICLGHQILSLAFGAKTYKLKFGHRGINQPVGMDGRVYITSQNHGFAVDRASAEKAGFEVNVTNLNDGTVEGLMHSELPIFSVQFHPEAHPGPHDTSFLFDRFLRMMGVA